MKNIAVLFRAAQLYAHRAHNLVKGATFFEDHEFLGDLYPVYETGYDNIVERMIGLGQSPNINQINTEACKMACETSETGINPMLTRILRMERSLQKALTENMAGATEGTKNLLAQLADDSEVRVYKLQQRLA